MCLRARRGPMPHQHQYDAARRPLLSDDDGPWRYDAVNACYFHLPRQSSHRGKSGSSLRAIADFSPFRKGLSCCRGSILICHRLTGRRIVAKTVEMQRIDRGCCSSARVPRSITVVVKGQGVFSTSRSARGRDIEPDSAPWLLDIEFERKPGLARLWRCQHDFPHSISKADCHGQAVVVQT